jgi:cytoplasmic iron level regulating protein YaaA (DUF328/UPF0246 family)
MTRSSVIILIHSSKSMRASAQITKVSRSPLLLDKACELDAYLKTLPVEQLEKSMHISATLALATHSLIASWNSETADQTPAIDCFIGDIYSGLRANGLSENDRRYADQTLRILSGLYGLLRPLDGIRPYRLEMGYAFPDIHFKNLYAFWGDAIAKLLPSSGIIVNVSSVEYTKVVLPFIDSARVITPNFLTINPQTGEPVFMAVHAKIARGAFARWLITTRITDPHEFHRFDHLGYRYSKQMSTLKQPTFICKTFEGKGLSIRLTS